MGRHVVPRRRRFERAIDDLLEHVAIGIGRTTADGRWIHVNQRLCDIVGYTREELLRLTFQDITHPDDLATALARARQLLANEIRTSSRQNRYVRKDRSVAWTELAVSVVREPPGAASFLAVVHDITDRKALEEAVSDFNDMLTVISGRTQLGLARLGPADPLRHDLDVVHATAVRAAVLTRQLVAGSRLPFREPRRVDLDEVVREAVDFLTRILGQDIALTLVRSAEPAWVIADTSQLEQVLANLALNARGAMPKGGRFDIETGHVGPLVMLAVTDTGIGMTPEVQARIFEPTFTTKTPPKGGGLGLATVDRIVKQSGGYINVESMPGRGTTLRLYLPRVE